MDLEQGSGLGLVRYGGSFYRKCPLVVRTIGHI
jgi:hypothetical protein